MHEVLQFAESQHRRQRTLGAKCYCKSNQVYKQWRRKTSLSVFLFFFICRPLMQPCEEDSPFVLPVIRQALLSIEKLSQPSSLPRRQWGAQCTAIIELAATQGGFGESIIKPIKLASSDRGWFPKPSPLKKGDYEKQPLPVIKEMCFLSSAIPLSLLDASLNSIPELPSFMCTRVKNVVIVGGDPVFGASSIWVVVRSLKL